MVTGVIFSASVETMQVLLWIRTLFALIVKSEGWSAQATFRAALAGSGGPYRTVFHPSNIDFNCPTG